MPAPHPPACLDLPAVAAQLGGTACRFDIAALAVCDSTNTELLRRAEAGAPSGSVIVADQQRAGRGRRGRTWHASPGDSLTFSLLWRFPPESSAPAALSLAVGVALARALEALGASEVRLKWPNDLLLAGRKLGGILIELQPGAVRSAIIGAGINLKLPPDLPPDVAPLATALAALPGPQPATRERVLATCLKHLQRGLDDYASHGFAALHSEWQARHAWHGATVRISGGGDDIVGLCHGVDIDGNLLLETPAGLRTVTSGDVSLRRSEGGTA
jgi:BirA family biotin operon repressor/biotin-[acetyl-CoA-carboxylase] ligase